VEAVPWRRSETRQWDGVGGPGIDAVQLCVDMTTGFKTPSSAGLHATAGRPPRSGPASQRSIDSRTSRFDTSIWLFSERWSLVADPISRPPLRSECRGRRCLRLPPASTSDGRRNQFGHRGSPGRRRVPRSLARGMGTGPNPSSAYCESLGEGLRVLAETSRLGEILYEATFTGAVGEPRHEGPEAEPASDRGHDIRRRREPPLRFSDRCSKWHPSARSSEFA
jgi:hypothetical protein